MSEHNSDVSFLNNIERVLILCEENYSSSDVYLQDEIFHRIRYSLQQLENAILTCACNDMENRYPCEYRQLQQLKDMLSLLSRAWGSRLLNLYTCRPSLNDSSDVADPICPVDGLFQNGPGRPKLNLQLRSIVFLFDVGFTISRIARLYGVHRNTIYAHVRNSGIELTRFSDLSRDELLPIVRNIYTDHPHCGVSMMLGHLRARNITTPREEVRTMLREIDPVNSQHRWGLLIQRRKYSVPGANSLWHIDGHHALIRWGIVTHGGVDGFSRVIVYLKSTTNNMSQTVLDLFISAVNKYGLPSRVRADLGGENVGVKHFMEANRGTMRGSFIGGRSVHNSRIERLWRDVFYAVIQTFYSLFHYLESMNFLDISNQLDMFTLHFIYLPRINRALDEFTAAYNDHPLRTEGHYSPNQLWIEGNLRNRHHLTDIASISTEQNPVDELEYGIDYDEMSNVHEREESRNDEDLVTDFSVTLSEAAECLLFDDCHPLQVSENYGIDLFLRAKNIVQTISQSL